MAVVPNANALILAELTKRVHGTFHDADLKVKPMVTLSSINTDASKAQKAVLAGRDTTLLTLILSNPAT